MSETPPVLANRRIRVAIDASPLASLAVELAAQLAAELRSDLEGLFYEDTQLLRLSGLPFVRETGSTSAAVRPLSLTVMERRLQAKADDVRRALARQCAQRNLTWSLTTLRDRVARRVLKSACDVDLLVIGVEGSQPRAWVRWRERRPSKHRVFVVYDGSEASRRALETCKLAATHGWEFLVLLVAATEDEALALGKEAQSQAPNAYVEMVARRSAKEIVQEVRSKRGELLIAPWELRTRGVSVDQLVDELDCLVLLVR